jgi:hypothetical protein
MIAYNVIRHTASAFALCSLVLFSSFGHAQNKVVVVPMAGDSVEPALIPVAVGSIDSIGGINSGYGIASVTNHAAGRYTITLTSNISPDNPIVNVTPYTGSPGSPEIAGYSPLTSNSFDVTIQDEAGNGVDSAFAFIVYVAPTPKVKSSSGTNQDVDGPATER